MELLFLLAFIFVALFAKLTFASEQVCLEKGFDMQVLVCSTCESMMKVVGEQVLYEDCKSCCRPDSENLQKYELAVLEVDKRFLVGIPELAAIVKMAKKLNLEVRYSFGSRPTLYMYKKDGDDSFAESIAVHTWNKDTFKEYLATHLTD